MQEAKKYLRSKFRNFNTRIYQGHFMISSQLKEKWVANILAIIAATSFLALGGIMLFLFHEGLPIFSVYSFWDFISGMYWYPTEEPPTLGILPLLAGSLSVTIIASIIAIPLGVLTAIYLAELAKPNVRRIIKPILELLAALPSVVIGFFGMVIVAPYLQNTFGIATGLNLFNASLMLAFMSVPTIASIAEDALYAVPNSLREASLALGATHLESISKVIVPSALSGIGTACILGMSRTIGETMVVLMVAGGAPILPTSIFDPVRPMPSSIAAEMAEAPFRGEHYYALFAIGIMLFLFTFAFNLLAYHITEKHKQNGSSDL